MVFGLTRTLGRACHSFLLFPSLISLDDSFTFSLFQHRISPGFPSLFFPRRVPLPTARYCTYFRLAGTHGFLSTTLFKYDIYLINQTVRPTHPRFGSPEIQSDVLL